LFFPLNSCFFLALARPQPPATVCKWQLVLTLFAVLCFLRWYRTGKSLNSGAFVVSLSSGRRLLKYTIYTKLQLPYLCVTYLHK
jgi:hypothetical protein